MLVLLDLTSFQSFQPCPTAPNVCCEHLYTESYRAQIVELFTSPIYNDL